jgi:hypothetical protein
MRLLLWVLPSLSGCCCVVTLRVRLGRSRGAPGRMPATRPWWQARRVDKASVSVQTVF